MSKLIPLHIFFAQEKISHICFSTFSTMANPTCMKFSWVLTSKKNLIIIVLRFQLIRAPEFTLKCVGLYKFVQNSGHKLLPYRCGRCYFRVLQRKKRNFYYSKIYPGRVSKVDDRFHVNLYPWIKKRLKCSKHCVVTASNTKLPTDKTALMSGDK